MIKFSISIFFSFSYTIGLSLLSRVFWTFICENLSWIEIIIRISVENCTNTGAKVFVLLRANCCTNCYYNFNPCGIFEKMTSFTQSRIGTRKINGGAKFSEIKVQKTPVVMFVIDWNMARYPGKTYCVRKRKKNGYREFDHSGSINIGGNSPSFSTNQIATWPVEIVPTTESVFKYCPPKPGHALYLRDPEVPFSFNFTRKLSKRNMELWRLKFSTILTIRSFKWKVMLRIKIRIRIINISL